MHLQVEHSFAFEYDTFIRESFLELRVQPKTTPQQAVLRIDADSPRTPEGINAKC